MSNNGKSVAIVGAGPVGLAAAAHCLERGLRPVVFEAGDSVGHAVRKWGHVRLFSPWEYNVDRAAQSLLAETGWNAPEPQEHPTGAELVEKYLDPLAARTPLRDHIRVASTVTAISRVGYDKVKTKGREKAPFEIHYRAGNKAQSAVVDAVIDVSGTWFSPNPAGGNGLPADGETAMAGRIAYGMPDVLGRERKRYAGKTIAVLGAGHSAAGTLIDLAKLMEEAKSTRVVWLIRGNSAEKSFGGGANDQLAARGELGSSLARLVKEGSLAIETNFPVSSLSERGGRLRIGVASACCGRHVLADELIVATGFRPEFGFLSELRLSLDPALECSPVLAPLIDPNEHSCGTVRPHGARELAQPDPGLYVAGMKSYGRAPTFLMMTGYEQVRSITAEIAGDLEAARRVELVLPETGVCSGAAAVTGEECCGGPAKLQTEVCCSADEGAAGGCCEDAPARAH